MEITPVLLTGRRAKLAPLALEHVSGLWDAGRSPDIWTFFPFRPRTLGEMAAYVQTLLNDQQAGTSLPFTIFDQETDRIVGSTRLHSVSVENRSAEIGTTWLAPDVWRTRLNTECKYLLLRHCFEKWQTVRVQLKTDLRNARSQRAIERLGAVREGVLRHHWIMLDGHVRDSVLYSILAAEWPAVKTHLAERLA